MIGQGMVRRALEWCHKSPNCDTAAKAEDLLRYLN